MAELKYVRARWPDPEVPDGSPEWLLYERDEQSDAVTRTVEFFPTGSVARNSIQIEERGGKPCPSLVEGSLRDGFGPSAEQITSEEFERGWAMGTDTAFWNGS